MAIYRWLGGFSIGFLVVALALAIFILTGRHSRRMTILVSGTVLALMITVSVICIFIYEKYGG